MQVMGLCTLIIGLLFNMSVHAMVHVEYNTAMYQAWNKQSMKNFISNIVQQESIGFYRGDTKAKNVRLENIALKDFDSVFECLKDGTSRKQDKCPQNDSWVFSGKTLNFSFLTQNAKQTDGIIFVSHNEANRAELQGFLERNKAKFNFRLYYVQESGSQVFFVYWGEKIFNNLQANLAASFPLPQNNLPAVCEPDCIDYKANLVGDGCLQSPIIGAIDFSKTKYFYLDHKEYKECSNMVSPRFDKNNELTLIFDAKEKHFSQLKKCFNNREIPVMDKMRVKIVFTVFPINSDTFTFFLNDQKSKPILEIFSNLQGYAIENYNQPMELPLEVTVTSSHCAIKRK